jgi:hypothetical protein
MKRSEQLHGYKQQLQAGNNALVERAQWPRGQASESPLAKTLLFSMIALPEDCTTK